MIDRYYEGTSRRSRKRFARSEFSSIRNCINVFIYVYIYKERERQRYIKIDR